MGLVGNMYWGTRNFLKGHVGVILGQIHNICPMGMKLGGYCDYCHHFKAKFVNSYSEVICGHLGSSEVKFVKYVIWA